MAEFKVVEKFVSINGEGKKAGQLAVFIRMAGCNLNCSYCDTRWANSEDAEYETMSEFQIYDYIKGTGIYNVTLTGGEPLMQESVYKLLNILSSDSNINVEVETNGSIPIKEYKSKLPDIAFTLDYKLKGSGMEENMCMDNFELAGKNDTVKFVVSDREDLKKAVEIVKQYRLTDKCSVYFSPVFGKIEPVEIVNFMMENKLNGVNMQLQLHKIIWNPNKRGV